MSYQQGCEQDGKIQMEWRAKKVRKNSMTSSCCVVLQSGALEMIVEIEACHLHLQEGDKLTPLANARYYPNNNPAQTLKTPKATHYSSEHWAKFGG